MLCTLQRRERVGRRPLPLPLLHQLAPCSVTPCTIFRKPPPLLSFLTRVDDRGGRRHRRLGPIRRLRSPSPIHPFVPCESPRRLRHRHTRTRLPTGGGEERRWWVNERAREEAGTGEGRQAAAWPPRRRPRPAAQRPGPSCFVVRVRPRG